MSILTVVGRASGKLPILALILVLTSASAGFAVTRTAVASGNFTSAATWSPAGAPANGDVLIINSPFNVTMNTGNIDGWPPSGSMSVIINNGGTLTRTGALTLNGSGASITVNSGGTLNVSGKLTVNQANLTIAGGTVNANSFETSGAVSVTSGTLNVTNELQVNGGTFVSSSGSTTTAGTLNVTSSGGSSFTNGGSFTVSGTVTAGGPITNNGTMNVGGDFNGGGGGSSTITNNAVLNITGNVTLPSSTKFYNRPGGVTTVTGNVTTSANQNLIVGTSTNPPPYADFIVKGNLISTGSGDVLIDRNGRLAVFGDFSANGGGSIFTINDGGQVYINGTINMNGNGNHITNNNDGNPYYGFYSPNQPTYSGGGSNSNGAAGSNTVQDVANMPTAFYNWVSTIPGSPLAAMPVKLSTLFKATLENDHVKLTWATINEEGFSHFELERASDDLQFETIGRVNGAGYTTTDVRAYNFNHINPVVGLNYYRLKAVDTDGTYEYFKVISVVVTSPKSVYVYANPSNGQYINVASNFSPGESTWVMVYRADGTLISQNNVAGRDVRIDFANQLASGVYLAKYVTNGYSQTLRFVVK